MTIEAQPTRLSPGDEVRARVTVGEPDGRAQGGRVRLLYVNSYQYQSTDGDGDTTTSTAHDDVVVAEAPLFGAHGAPAAGTYEISLRVPDDAPPSAEDAVEYEMVATIDRKGRRDSQVEVELLIASAPTAYADRAARPAEQPDEFWAEIEAVPRELTAGAAVAGTVTVTSPAGLEGRALRVRTRGVRRDHDGLTTSYDGEPQTLAEPAALTAGGAQSHAFGVRVPADAPPTFKAEHNALEWTLEVYVDRKLRGDPVARLPLVVRSGP